MAEGVLLDVSASFQWSAGGAERAFAQFSRWGSLLDVHFPFLIFNVSIFRWIFVQMGYPAAPCSAPPATLSSLLCFEVPGQGLGALTWNPIFFLQPPLPPPWLRKGNLRRKGKLCSFHGCAKSTEYLKVVRQMYALRFMIRPWLGHTERLPFFINYAFLGVKHPFPRPKRPPASCPPPFF